MWWSVLIASGIVFALLIGWVLVDKAFKKSITDNPDCELPEHECSHCIMADGCSMHGKEEEEERE